MFSVEDRAQSDRGVGVVVNRAHGTFDKLCIDCERFAGRGREGYDRPRNYYYYSDSGDV